MAPTPSPRFTHNRTGVVLIMALLALALITILLVALLNGSTHQIHAAESDAAYAREKMLADTAVALVVGQIRQASTQTGQTWISQPGLLRTYDTTSSRTPTACYKLYSTPQISGMTDTTGTLGFLSTDVPADWNSTANQSFYTDLNASQQTPGLFSQTIYPIFDPAAVTNLVGVSIDSGHSAEMPVAWLYQLQDGTLGPASNGTKTNPIVARLAFWTDDDACKININTAGYGSAWNTPRVNSTDDVTWSADPPASGEYSSYPGHPAMTSLAEVFGQGSSPLTAQQMLSLTPRYSYGGSELGTQTTTSGEVVAAKADRLYASVDELLFGTGFTNSGQRQANPLTAGQLQAARFVLTAHSQSPETTMLGEPRFAIWPVADSTSIGAPRITATDRAVMSAATVGARDYFFQRHNAQSSTDDLSATVTPGNVQFFNDLVARGNETLPGYGTNFSRKYTGATWTQLMLEITDFIRGINPVDPTPAPFVPYAAGDSSGLGCGFILPLTTNYGSGSNSTTLRGFGRCPTLSSLTLVFYVCGFGFKDGTVIDYDATPDDRAGTSWIANFLPGSGQWKNVTNELVRAFVVPCTFQPGCGYPEVSDACDIQITGLDGIQVTSGGKTGNFGFAPTATSPLLGNQLEVLSAERAWGGNEGPVTWRAIGDALANGTAITYPFAGSKAFAVPMTTSSATALDPKTALIWPPTYNLRFSGVTGLTVLIRDRNGNTLQTLSVNLPSFSGHAPTNCGEGDHADGTTPATSSADWATNTTTKVQPSYYMNLKNRLLATQRSRPMMIQAGDISRGVEANTDLRVLAGLATVPSTFFSPHPGYQAASLNNQNGSHAQNLCFADGMSVCFAPGVTTSNNQSPTNASYGYTSLVRSAHYPTTILPLLAATDWHDGTTQVSYDIFTSPSRSAPTGSTSVTMSSNVPGDWDTGPGFAPDGAQINLPDSGTTLPPATAYFSLTGGQVGAATQRTPNALVPSPVIFGSLPAGIDPVNPAQSEPWRTLLFCPYPAANNTSTPYAVHPGSASPPDYLILDNFWMPVVEPYSISTCMTTAGKINLNDPIAPFTWLHRNTALHALLSDLRIPAISYSMASSYKSSGTPLASIWNAVDETATIAQIENRFANGSVDAYLTEGEICSVPLVPQGQAADNVTDTQTALEAFWNTASSPGGQLTGDNLRELPYAQLYSRLTTRSNSYMVHVRVQVLKKLPNDPQQNVWNEGVDLVQGDWRGSYEIERYLDPAAAAPDAGQALGPYKYRIVSSQRFAP